MHKKYLQLCMHTMQLSWYANYMIFKLAFCSIKCTMNALKYLGVKSLLNAPIIILSRIRRSNLAKLKIQFSIVPNANHHPKSNNTGTVSRFEKRNYRFLIFSGPISKRNDDFFCSEPIKLLLVSQKKGTCKTSDLEIQ